MDKNIDESNKCPVCSSENNSYLIETNFDQIKNITNLNSEDVKLFKWLVCENLNCDFWTREPKR